MISFKRFFESKTPIFSEKEKVNIIGVGTYVAKVDTGNDVYCVLNGENIRFEDDIVSFDVDNGKRITKRLLDRIKINVGAGVEEERPIVEFDIKLKGKEYKGVKFTIGNRKDNDEKVLLGLKFLKPLKATVKL